MAFLEIGDHRLNEYEVSELLATDHPMVEAFRFEPQHNQGGRSLHFALVIVPRKGVRYLQQRDGWGDRIEPEWKTLTGREQVGRGNRHMWVEMDEIVASNDTFFPNQEFNDLGIGSALYVSMERFYRRLGIRRVTLLAVDVGVYVWARQGFAFQRPDRCRELARSLGVFLDEEGLELDRDFNEFTRSWDFANYDASGRPVDGYRAGKAFMLKRAPGWSGVRYLDDEEMVAVAEASRAETFSRLPGKIEGAPGTLAVR